MKEKIFDIGDDYWIETMKGRWAYMVDGKALHLRCTCAAPAQHAAPRCATA